MELRQVAAAIVQPRGQLLVDADHGIAGSEPEQHGPAVNCRSLDRSCNAIRGFAAHCLVVVHLVPLDCHDSLLTP